MPASKYKLERKCEMCGSTFFAKTIYSVYCSKRCSEAAYRAKKREEKKEQHRQELANKVPQERPYISIAEAVAMFGISRDTIYRLIRNGNLPAVNLGVRLTRISRAHIESMFPLVEQKQQTTSTTQPTKSYNFDASDSYTIGEVSTKYSVSNSTVYKTIRKIGIPTCQKGKYVFVPKEEIDRVFNPSK